MYTRTVEGLNVHKPHKQTSFETDLREERCASCCSVSFGAQFTTMTRSVGTQRSLIGSVDRIFDPHVECVLFVKCSATRLIGFWMTFGKVRMPVRFQVLTVVC